MIKLKQMEKKKKLWLFISIAVAVAVVVTATTLLCVLLPGKKDEKVIVAMTIDSSGAKTSYIEGEELSVDGLVVKLFFDDNSVSVLDRKDYRINSEVYNKNVIGKYLIKVTYGEHSRSYEVNVTENLTKIVTFYIGNEVYATKTVQKGNALSSLPVSPLQELFDDDKQFGGWYTSTNFETVVVGNEIINSNISYYAMPVIRTVSLYFHNTNGDVIDIRTKMVDYGSTASFGSSSIEEAPTRAGEDGKTYTFAGWTTYMNGPIEYGINEEVTMNGDVHLYPVYTVGYTVTFYSDNLGTVYETITNVQVGSNILELLPVAKRLTADDLCDAGIFSHWEYLSNPINSSWVSDAHNYSIYMVCE